MGYRFNNQGMTKKNCTQYIVVNDVNSYARGCRTHEANSSHMCII